MDVNNTEQAKQSAEGPLSGIRVVEMGQLIAGPFCGQLLGDHGAEVIKFEQPGVGDPLRQWGNVRPDDRSVWWSVIGRNKKSVTLNLRTPEGQELAREVIDTADVVIENFRPGTAEKWNLGYETLAERNPGIIFTRVSGFGQTGPYSHRPGYGSIGEAMGGLRYVVGDPSTPPSRMGISIGDTLAATFAALGTLSALHERERSGKGQIVDAAIYESVLAVMESLVPDWAVGNYQRERSGSILPKIAPSNVYPTKDGSWILIAANQDTVFPRLAKAIGLPDMASDPRFETHHARGENQQELDDLIAKYTAQQDADKLEEQLIEHAVPVGKIYKAEEMLEDPQFQARDSIINVHEPRLGNVPMQNAFPRLSRTDTSVRWPGPGLGAHTDEVLESLIGKSQAEIADLKSKGVV